MKTKKIILSGLVAVSCLALASCGGDDLPQGGNPGQAAADGHTYVAAPADAVYATEGGRVDINNNYGGSSGITLRGGSYTNVVDNVTYVEGQLLPVWRAFAEKTKTQIVEASAYTTNTTADTYAKVAGNGFKSEQDANQIIDLLAIGNTEINTMGASGQAVNLMEHLDEMPNFKAWLEKYPSQAQAIITNYGKDNASLYYTPYYEGQNNLERMLVMDTQLVEKVLDNANANYDTQTTNGGSNPSANVVQSGSYKPFLDATNNYGSAQTLKVLDKDNAVVEVSPKIVKNIIVRQNELLANGCTGKALAEQFNAYLTEAYGDYMGAGKLYEKPSEIFTTQKAVYNVDELIALMRVIKANPGLISGDQNLEVETLFCRAPENNRVDTIARLAQLWGVQGVGSSKDWLYFDANGKLNDAQTTKGTYDALQYLSQLYDEGLILTEFWYKPQTISKTEYLDRFYGKTVDKSSYGFMCWDFGAATAATNDIESGIGTRADQRKIAYESKGIRPVLPPYTYWATEKNWDHSQDLTNFTGKTLTRYVEKNTALKTGSWVIPSVSDNIPGALRIMDYLFHPMGSYIQSFGPEEYWAKPEGATTAMVSSDLLGATSETDWENLTPVMSQHTKLMLVNSETSFYNFMREKLGATHGIGHVRSKGCDLQATNAYGQVGMAYLQAAISKGVVVKNVTDPVGSGAQYTWDQTIPSLGKYQDTAGEYDAVSAFWPSNPCATTTSGWVRVIAEKSTTDLSNVAISKLNNVDYTYAQTLAAFSIKDKAYLLSISRDMSINGRDAIPSYARS
ncbi:MAG: hypothetical protein K2K15_03955 [Anaeroplasmataceae bacterium]|nr:hypothetical protein [Anaeroplasmataceae bacterium]